MLLNSLLALLLLAPAPAAFADTPNERAAAHVFLVKMGKGDFSNLDRIYAPGFRAHSGGKTYTLDEDNVSGRAIREAAPDLQVAIERMAGDGDLVSVHWRARGTNSRAAAGMPGHGKKFEVEGMTFFRFEGGRIAEEWSLTDRMALLAQLK